ncbi:activating signal cointegrator 1 complex subunit 2 homolog [Osmia bicornis bicornis]|uniref:activating signal cointegrator 1 complex subunit 2 homolog n=1 Tax=Osmia bicornis bicornis TaxID=1437191 RepID=UPI001EAE9660|nr:activating signal cointegrator 1 complex subunit 2 homolog [Osmia bicornis bicornis]
MESSSTDQEALTNALVQLQQQLQLVPEQQASLHQQFILHQQQQQQQQPQPQQQPQLQPQQQQLPQHQPQGNNKPKRKRGTAAGMRRRYPGKWPRDGSGGGPNKYYLLGIQ